MYSYSELERLPGISALLDQASELKSVDYGARQQLLDGLIREADDAIVDAFAGSGLGLCVVEDAQKSFRYWSHFVSDVYVPTSKLEEWTQ